MMEKILFAGYTVQDALLAAGIGIGFIILISILKKIFRKKQFNPHMQFVVCNDCGWEGQVSRHAGRCPGCNLPLGGRLIERGQQHGGPAAGS